MGEDREQEKREQSRQRNWTARLVLFAVVLLALVVFVAQNFNVVEVRFLVWQPELRLGWALIIAGGLGFVLGLLFRRVWRAL